MKINVVHLFMLLKDFQVLFWNVLCFLLKLWTAEEQRRLEELLIQYPPEEVEARRWQKIAAALGNFQILC
jgi:hypothetical protein